MANGNVTWPGALGRSGAGRDATDLSTRDLLLMVLGDYWLGSTEPIPSGALVAVLGEFGTPTANTRAALRRLVSRGVLDTSRSGRSTFYRFSDLAARGGMDRGRRLMRFGLDEPGWNGEWTCLVFTLTEDANRIGQALRAGLRRLRLAQLYNGFWVSPHDVTDSVGALLSDLGVVTATILRARVADLDLQGRHPIEAYDLDALRAAYVDFIHRMKPIITRIRANRIGPTESLITRTALVEHWSQYFNDDPRIPTDLLPADWPLAAARAAFVTVYDGLGPPAETRMRDLVSPFELDAEALPFHHRAADLADGTRTRSTRRRRPSSGVGRRTEPA